VLTRGATEKIFAEQNQDTKLENNYGQGFITVYLGGGTFGRRSDVEHKHIGEASPSWMCQELPATSLVGSKWCDWGGRETTRGGSVDVVAARSK